MRIGAGFEQFQRALDAAAARGFKQGQVQFRRRSRLFAAVAAGVISTTGKPRAGMIRWMPTCSSGKASA